MLFNIIVAQTKHFISGTTISAVSRVVIVT